MSLRQRRRCPLHKAWISFALLAGLLLSHSFLPNSATASASSMSPPVDGSLSWSNGYAAFNRAGNHMYHTGLDLVGVEGITPIKAAEDGTVVRVVGLAPQGGGSERLATWDDKNTNQIVDPGEISGLFSSERSENNHGLGITIIVHHTSTVSTLYAHLYAVTEQIYEAVVVAGRAFPVSKGQPIGVLGSSVFNTYTGGTSPHIHFEVKERPLLESPRSDSSGPYWGYTPDLPDTYGYNDLFLHFYPPPSPTPTMVALEVINEEGGSSDPDRGIRIYAGPGVNYSVFGWTGLNQKFVAHATAMSTTPGDSIPNRLWYRIDLPNRLGLATGWIASQTTNATPLVQIDPFATTVKVINDGGVGWRLRLDPSLDCTGGFPSNCVQVWDNTYAQYRSVVVWNGLRFVTFATQTISAVLWYGVYIPKLYFHDPKTTSKLAPPQDNVVGEIETAWLSESAVSSSIAVGQGAPTTYIRDMFIAAYNAEAGAPTMGTPTTPVTSFVEDFYSPPIQLYYQQFNGGSYGE